MVLSTEWTQLEVVNLVNDGFGLGFGIIGGKSTGVVVKTISPGGVADRDGRLHSGDHLLQINDINVRGMGSEQVASVLRQSGAHVRLIVARAVVEPPPPEEYLAYAPIIPTDHLSEHIIQLNAILSGYPLTPDGAELLGVSVDLLPAEIHQIPLDDQLSVLHLGPDVEMFEVTLVKDNAHGLGITIAGYVSDRSAAVDGAIDDDLSGIFVRSITAGSAAALDGRIQIHDQIIAVDSQSLEGFSNQQAVEVLRNTASIVHLKLARYKYGPKYDQLLRYCSQRRSDVGLTNGGIHCPIETSIHLINIDDYGGDLIKEVEDIVVAKWKDVLGEGYDIVVAQVCKFKEGGGLGISLEGTVDVENGVEVHPHHYIRSVITDGPVGLNGRLHSGDELLEVNGVRLLGVNHLDVVLILKDLPKQVRIVCARRQKTLLNGAVATASTAPLPHPPPTSSTSLDEQFNHHPSMQDELFQVPSPPQTFMSNHSLSLADRLFKAKSDQTLWAGAGPGGLAGSGLRRLGRLRSHSLEPLSGLAIWGTDVVVIELVKGEKGLGFSILDYQDPINQDETVIIIRSLVPGGVAQLDGRLVPGDRLLFVNDVHLEKACLDDAVLALKNASPGTVLLGVAKPLPLLPDIGENSLDEMDSVVLNNNNITSNNNHNNDSNNNNGATAAAVVAADINDSVYISMPLPYSFSRPLGESPISILLNAQDDLPHPSRSLASSELNNYFAQTATMGHVTDDVMADVTLTPLTTLTIEHEGSVPQDHNHSHGSNPSNNPPMVDQKTSAQNTPVSSSPVTRAPVYPDPGSQRSCNGVFGRAHDEQVLPAGLEQAIKINKGSEPLGLHVDAVAGAMNGCTVTSLTANQAAAKDGRIKVNDLIVSVNNESMRRITNSQASAILRRTALLHTDISVTFIPGEVAKQHREAAMAAVALTGVRVATPGDVSPRPLDTAWFVAPTYPPVSSPAQSTSQMTRYKATTNALAPCPQTLIEPGNSENPTPIPTLTFDVSYHVSSELSSSTRAGSETVLKSTDTEQSVISLDVLNMTISNVGDTSSPAPDLNVQCDRIIVANKDVAVVPLAAVNAIPVAVTSLGDFPATGVDLLPPASNATISTQLASSSSVLNTVYPTDLSLISSIAQTTGQQHAQPTASLSAICSNAGAGKGLPVHRLRVSNILREGEDEEVEKMINGSPCSISNDIDYVLHKITSTNIDALCPDVSGLPPSKEVFAVRSFHSSSSIVSDVQDALLSGIEDVHDAFKTLDRLGELHRIVIDLRGVTEINSNPEPISSLCPLLGLCLTGHKDTSIMAVFVAGILPASRAAEDGRIWAGDQILKVNNEVLYGRSHLQASAVIRSICSSKLEILLLRRPDYKELMAVPVWLNNHCLRSLDHQKCDLTTRLVCRQPTANSLQRLPSNPTSIFEGSILASTDFTLSLSQEMPPPPESNNRIKTDNPIAVKNLDPSLCLTAATSANMDQVLDRNPSEMTPGNSVKSSPEKYILSSLSASESDKSRALPVIDALPPALSRLNTQLVDVDQTMKISERILPDDDALRPADTAAFNNSIKTESCELGNSSDDAVLQSNIRTSLNKLAAAASAFQSPLVADISETQDNSDVERLIKIEDRVNSANSCHQYSDLKSDKDQTKAVSTEIFVLSEPTPLDKGIVSSEELSLFEGPSSSVTERKTDTDMITGSVPNIENKLVLVAQDDVTQQDINLLESTENNPTKDDESGTNLAAANATITTELATKTVSISVPCDTTLSQIKSQDNLTFASQDDMSAIDVATSDIVTSPDITASSVVLTSSVVMTSSGDDATASVYNNNRLETRTVMTPPPETGATSETSTIPTSGELPKLSNSDACGLKVSCDRLVQPSSSESSTHVVTISDTAAAASSDLTLAYDDVVTNSSCDLNGIICNKQESLENTASDLSLLPNAAESDMITADLDIAASSAIDAKCSKSVSSPAVGESDGHNSVTTSTQGGTSTTSASSASVAEKERKKHNKLKVPRTERRSDGGSDVSGGGHSPSAISQDGHSSGGRYHGGHAHSSSSHAHHSKRRSTSSTCMEDPRVCQIVPGQETYIELHKSRGEGFGIDVVGGVNTLLGAVMINEIFDDGVAAKDGRLRIGDQILEVNGEDLREATDEWAVEVLRGGGGAGVGTRARGGRSDCVYRMLIFREEMPLAEEDIYDIFNLDLMKKPGRGLGFSIVSRGADQGIFISDIITGGVADLDGRLMTGDQILVVNGFDIRRTLQQEAAALLKTLMGRVSLTIGRIKRLSPYSSRDSSSLGVDTDEEVQAYLDDRSVEKT